VWWEGNELEELHLERTNKSLLTQ
jgi:hypothetical protein